jgi:hypothetical protein
MKENIKSINMEFSRELRDLVGDDKMKELTAYRKKQKNDY